jgi:tRNA (guanine-N7-)-methyltransferase
MARPLSKSLQDHVVDWKPLPWPPPWEHVFTRAAPLALEIGFGNGAFLVEQALARPDRNHLGIELSWTAATHLFRRLAKVDAPHVRVLLGEAEVLVERLLAPGSLAEVFVNHPCPWPKARHHERRLLRREFLNLLATRMAPGAPLTIVTDHAGYAEWLHEELAAQHELVSRHDQVEVAEIPGRTPTKYQRKAMDQGIPIHFFEWRRRPDARAEPTPPHVSDPQAAMPTVSLEGPVQGARDAVLEGFERVVHRERHGEVEVVVKLESVFRRVDAPVWIVETLVQEDKLSQVFGLEVVDRGTSWLVKPGRMGHPHPTHGVRRALVCLTDWIRTRHPGLTVTHENLGSGLLEEETS